MLVIQYRRHGCCLSFSAAVQIILRYDSYIISSLFCRARRSAAASRHHTTPLQNDTAVVAVAHILLARHRPPSLAELGAAISQSRSTIILFRRRVGQHDSWVIVSVASCMVWLPQNKSRRLTTKLSKCRLMPAGHIGHHYPCFKTKRSSFASAKSWCRCRSYLSDAKPPG